jgi:hypothetical protein
MASVASGWTPPEEGFQGGFINDCPEFLLESGGDARGLISWLGEHVSPVDVRDIAIKSSHFHVQSGREGDIGLECTSDGFTNDVSLVARSIVTPFGAAKDVVYVDNRERDWDLIIMDGFGDCWVRKGGRLGKDGSRCCGRDDCWAMSDTLFKAPNVEGGEGRLINLADFAGLINDAGYDSS